MDAKKVIDATNTYKRKGKDKATEKALEEEAPEKGPKKATDKVTEEILAEGRVYPTASNRLRQRERGEEPKRHIRTKRKAKKVVHDDEDAYEETEVVEKVGETMTGVDEAGETEVVEKDGETMTGVDEVAGMGVRDFAAEVTSILLSVGGDVSDEGRNVEKNLDGNEHTNSGGLENRKKNAADVQPYSSSSSDDEPDADYHVSPIPRGELHSQEDEGVEGEGEGEGEEGGGEDYDDLRPFSSDEDDAPDAVGEEQVGEEVVPEGEELY